MHTMKFNDIPEKVWRGETFSSAEEFRECHIRCMPEYDLNDEFEFMIVHFKLVEAMEDSDKTEQAKSDSGPIV